MLKTELVKELKEIEKIIHDEIKYLKSRDDSSLRVSYKHIVAKDNLGMITRRINNIIKKLDMPLE